MRRSVFRRPLALLSLAGCILLAGALLVRQRGTRPPAQLGEVLRSGAAAGFNVVLITLDTTRRDRLGCYGYAGARTPTIDALAESGVCFDDAVTSSPVTLPSHTTLLTGLYPPRHGVRDNGAFQLAPEHSTLAETLKANGYDTAAFIGCFVLDERFGLSQGFDVYDFQVTPAGHREAMPDFNERPADAVTDAAIGWMGQRPIDRRPFFLWVHYFDPHLPYQSPLQDLPAFAGRPYDAEIAFVDSQIKRLMGELDACGFRNRTLVALVADHGEGLGDHDEATHGLFVYDSTIRIPMILSCPELFGGAYRVDDRVVGLVDLRVSIEDLLGIPPTERTDGRNLLAPGADPDRAIYIETQVPFYSAGWSPLCGLRLHTAKYIRAPRPEHYDLHADPSESENLARSRPPRLVVLEQQLAQLVNRWESETPAGDAARRMSEEESRRLGSLGYVRTNADVSDGTLPDPKDMIPLNNRAMHAETLYKSGRTEEALILIREVADESPTFTYAHRLLADILVSRGQKEEAAEILLASAERNPAVITFIDLGRVLRDLRRFSEAEAALEAAEALDPGNGKVPVLRGDCLAYQHRYPEAIAQYEHAIRMDGNRVGIIARQRIATVRERMRK